MGDATPAPELSSLPLARPRAGKFNLREGFFPKITFSQVEAACR